MAHYTLKQFIYSLIFICLISSVNFVKAQENTVKPITVSKNIISDKGYKVYIHKVEQGQTLYSISKAYNVTIPEIEQWNDTLKTGLKTGMELKIPKEPILQNSKPSVKENGNKYIIHTVEKKQTLYAISKKYNVTVESIVAENPEAESGLKEGMTIKIPQKGKTIQDTKEVKNTEAPIIPVINEERTTPKYNGGSLAEINVNLFLPFYLLQNDSVIQKETLSENDELYSKSIPGVEFLSGFQLACDSLIKKGNKINLNVYDTPADSLASLSFFANKQFKQADIWVGPFHSSVATAAAKAVKNKNTLLVLPYTAPNKVLMGKENVVKVNPSLPTSMDSYIAQLYTQYKNNNFVIIHNNLNKEKQIVSLLKKAYKIRSSGDSIKEIVYKTAGIKGLTAALSKYKNNLIIVGSSDQAFVTDFFNKIKSLDDKEYKISVAGMEQWINYDNLDINMIQKFGLVIPSNTCINYSDTLTCKFIENYRNRFQTEPGKYAFNGYDVAMYFLPLLSKYGYGCINKFEENKNIGFSTIFHLKKTGIDSGFENQSIFMLKYEDYELKKL